jgi:hypothetical protein
MTAPNRANDSARKPKLEDVRSAYFSGKVTTEEANDLSGTKSFTPKSHPHNIKSNNPSDFSLDHAAEQAHRRAGLSQ